MGREWKPGNVAMVGSPGQQVRAMWTEDCKRSDVDHPGDPHWHVASGRFFWATTDARPLVTIDPEDPEQVKRLRDAMRFFGMAVEEWQAALRSLVEPPKPPEPTGLGAVVEDSDGRWWVRIEECTERDLVCPWRGPTGHEGYDEITAVKVLSEGVQP